MDSSDGGSGRTSETDRHHYVTNEKGKRMICAKLIRHWQREEHRCNMSARAERAQLCTCIRSLSTEAPNVRDSTNSTNTAILNTGNHNRYRGPDLIRFDSDSAYVILQLHWLQRVQKLNREGKHTKTCCYRQREGGRWEPHGWNVFMLYFIDFYLLCISFAENPQLRNEHSADEHSEIWDSHLG